MPINKANYPPNWAEISKQVRAEANQQCEWCSAPNGKCIERIKKGPRKGDWYLVYSVRDIEGVWIDATKAPAALLRLRGVTKIILTVAHLDRNTHNNERSNLAALCQRCHLNHDRQAQHIPNRKYGKAHAEQPKLF